MIRFVGLAFAFFSVVSQAQAPCRGCEKTVASLRTELREVNQKINQIEKGAPSRRAESEQFAFFSADPEPTPPPEGLLFFQRLEAYDNWKSSQTRLDTIEIELQKLENEIAADKAAGRNSVDQDRIDRLSRSQRLVVAELKAQLDQIYRKFKTLDAQIAAHEQSIDAVKGGLASVSAQFKDIASGLKSHLVASSSSSYESVFEAKKLFTKDLDLGEVWVFPRAELSYDAFDNIATQVTVSAEGNLFSIIKGEAKAGLIFDSRYTTSAYALSPGTEPILTSTGVAARDAAMYCVVAKTVTYRGFGSVGASAGLDLKVVKFGTNTSVEIGETMAIGAKRYGALLQFRQGEAFESKLDVCRAYAKQVRETDALAQEVSGMIRVLQIPESPCYKDYDCRNEVKLGLLAGSVVSNCVANKNRERAVCQLRYADTEGATCSKPNESVYNFRFHCANGFTCNRKTRKCDPTKTGEQWLKESGIAKAKPMGLSVSYSAVRPPIDDTNGAKFCEAQGLKGWKLPTGDQLKATAEWYRAWGRAQLRQRNPRAEAQKWFYAEDLYTRMLWSDGSAVYLLNNDSGGRYNPENPQNDVLFRDPKTGETITTGVAICVRPIK